MRTTPQFCRIGGCAGSPLAPGRVGRGGGFVSNARRTIPGTGPAIHVAEARVSKAKPVALGIMGEDFDLRHYFGKHPTLVGELSRYDRVRVVGGNAFTLRRAMRESGFETVIAGGLDRDAIGPFGRAAGPAAAVAGPIVNDFVIIRTGARVGVSTDLRAIA